MSGENTNHGVQITGSHVNAGAIAGGKGASASAHHVNMASDGAGLEDVRDLLAALAEELRTPPPEVTEPEVMTAIVTSAQTEAAKERPNLQTLSRLLRALMNGAGNVASLATAISAVQHAVSALL